MPTETKFFRSFFWILLFDGTFKSFIKGIFAKRYKELYQDPMNDGSGSRRPKNTWIRRIRIRNSVLSTGWFLRKISFFFEMEFLNSIFSRGYRAYSQVLSGFLPFCKILIINRLDFWSRDSFFCECHANKTRVFLFRGFFVRVFPNKIMVLIRFRQ